MKKNKRELYRCWIPSIVLVTYGCIMFHLSFTLAAHQCTGQSVLVARTSTLVSDLPEKRPYTTSKKRMTNDVVQKTQPKTEQQICIEDSIIYADSVAERSDIIIQSAPSSVYSEIKRVKEKEMKEMKETRKKKHNQDKPVELAIQIEEISECEASEYVLTASAGVNYNANGNKETWYNLDMSGVVQIMRNQGFSEEDYPYWVREDGVKMLGSYVMVAANLSVYPRGSVVHTSLGEGLVCDTGGFAESNPYQFDIAVSW